MAVGKRGVTKKKIGKEKIKERQDKCKREGWKLKKKRLITDWRERTRVGGLCMTKAAIDSTRTLCGGDLPVGVGLSTNVR